MGSLKNAQGSAGTPKRRTLATRGLGFLLLISSCNAILGNEEGKLDPDADPSGAINGGKANAGKPGSEDGGAGDSSNTDGGKAGKGNSPGNRGGESGDGNEAGAAGTPDTYGGAGAGGAGGSPEPPPASGGKGGTGSGSGGKAGSGGSGGLGGSGQGESCDPSTFVPSCGLGETWRYCPSRTAQIETITCDGFCSIFGFPAAGICKTTSTNEGFCWCEEYSIEALECDHGALAATNYCAGGCDGCVTEEDYDYIYMDRYLGCYLEEPDYAYVPCYASGWLSEMCIDSCSASGS